MSFGGMLASGVAGGAKAYGDQLTRDIAAQTESDLFKTKAQIMEESRMREMEYQERLRQSGKLADVTGPIAEGTLAMEKRRLGQTTEEQVRAAPLLAGAQRTAEMEAVGQPGYLAAHTKMILSDPRVGAQVQEAMAKVGASNQQTALLKEQLNQTVKVGQVADSVRALQSQLENATGEDERAAIQQKITDLGFTGKDPAKFLALAEKAQDNVRDAIKILADPTASPAAIESATRALAKASDLSEQAAKAGGIKLKEPAKQTQDQAEADARDAIKTKGWTLDKANQRLVQQGYKPMTAAQVKSGASTGMLNTRAPSDDAISFNAAGYGTGTYRYRGADYPTLAAAQAAKATFEQGWNEPVPQASIATP